MRVREGWREDQERSEATTAQFTVLNIITLNSSLRSSLFLLTPADFKELDERVSWAGKLKPGGRYFFQRDAVLGSSLVAFVVGGSFSPENNSAGGFKVLGAHTDSPNLRIKPRSERKAGGCLQLDVETYGGGEIRKAGRMAFNCHN